MRYRVTNLTTRTLLADRARSRPELLLHRFMGLMGRSELPFGAGLHIVPCNSIHTFFMRIPIDVVFLDRELEVVEVLPAMPPWRMSRVYFGAHSVLELPAGTSLASGTAEGTSWPSRRPIDARATSL